MLIWLLGTLIHVAHKTVIVFLPAIPSVSSAPPRSKLWGWRNTSTSSCWCYFFFFFKDFSFRLMEVAQRDFTTAVPEESLPSISFPWNKWAPFGKRSTVSLCPWSLSQSRNKTKSQPYMSLSLATLQSGPCQVFLSQRFFSQRKMLREKKKKNLSANVSKFEVRCQLLALVVKISSLCICKAACMALW